MFCMSIHPQVAKKVDLGVILKRCDFSLIVKLLVGGLCNFGHVQKVIQFHSQVDVFGHFALFLPTQIPKEPIFDAFSKID